MFDKDPNIDIVFRNGLKNFEVLPPSDVWDNIPPMPVRKPGYRLVMSIAAGIAVLVSITLFASWYLRSSGNAGEGTQLAMATNDQLPMTETPAAISNPVIPAKTTAFRNTSVQAPVTIKNNEIIEGIVETPVVSPTVSVFPEPEEVANYNKTLPLTNDNITVIASARLTSHGNYPSQAMTPDKPEASEQRFMVGASVSPSMGFSPSEQNAHMAELIGSEKTRPSYTTGLTFGYKLSQRLTIQSGIGLESVGQTITDVDVFAGLSDFYSAKSNYLYSIETASGTILAGNTDLYLTDTKNRVGSMIPKGMADPSKYNLTQVGSNIHQVFRYLELPIVLRYKVIDRKVDLNLSGGMSYGYLVDNYAYTRDEYGTIPVGRTEGVNVHSLSSQLGLGMEYNISSTISFNFEPILRYYVTPVSNFSGTLYKPYSVGFFSGIFFKF
jgi:hypothetical protein